MEFPSCDLTGQIVKRCDFSNGNTEKNVVNSVICKLLVDLSHIERWISHIHGQDGVRKVSFESRASWQQKRIMIKTPTKLVNF